MDKFGTESYLEQSTFNQDLFQYNLASFTEAQNRKGSNFNIKIFSMFQKFIPTQIHYSPLKSQNLKILQPNQMQTKFT